MIDYEKLKEIRNMGYIKHTGIRTVELREGYAKCEIILDERHANPISMFSKPKISDFSKSCASVPFFSVIRKDIIPSVSLVSQ